MQGIYKITNISNDKVYIGQAVNIKARFSKHKWALRNNKHHSIHLQRAWNLYGEDAFKFEIIEEVTEANQLVILEQKYLDFFKSYDDNFGYNIAMNAENSMKGRNHTEEWKESRRGEKHPLYGKHHSDETLQLMSDSHSGKKNPNFGKQFTEEHKKKLSDAHLGNFQSEETRKKIGDSSRGIPRTKEICDKISKANTGKVRSIETRRKLSFIQTGRIQSEESSNKKREAMKLYWKKKKGLL